MRARMLAALPEARAEEREPVEAERARIPSAASVCGPTMPSTVRPWARWKRLTARRVCGPKMPSAGMPSARWTAATDEPALRTAAAPPDDVPAASAPPVASVSEASATPAPARKPRRRRSARTAAKRRARERRSDSSHGAGDARSVVDKLDFPLVSGAYGVSCRARAEDLRYVAFTTIRPVEPSHRTPIGSPAPRRAGRRGLGSYELRRGTIYARR